MTQKRAASTRHRALTLHFHGGLWVILPPSHALRSCRFKPHSTDTLGKVCWESFRASPGL